MMIDDWLSLLQWCVPTRSEAFDSSLVVVGNIGFRWKSKRIPSPGPNGIPSTTIHYKNVKKRDQFSTKVKCQLKKKPGSDGGTSFMWTNTPIPKIPNTCTVLTTNQEGRSSLPLVDSACRYRQNVVDQETQSLSKGHGPHPSPESSIGDPLPRSIFTNNDGDHRPPTIPWHHHNNHTSW